jgi:hypothetical protein
MLSVNDGASACIWKKKLSFKGKHLCMNMDKLIATSPSSSTMHTTNLSKVFKWIKFEHIW